MVVENRFAISFKDRFGSHSGIKSVNREMRLAGHILFILNNREFLLTVQITYNPACVQAHSFSGFHFYKICGGYFWSEYCLKGFR